jgi:uncharacterized membrane protein YgdD (TMEM256/DUF423 family)
MKNYYRIFLLLGSFFGFTGVALGAFGAHGLKSILSAEMLSVFETAVRYQMYHAFALIAAALIHRFSSHRFNIAAGWFFAAGIILFSGSLYVLVLTELRWFGIITPFGGLSFLLGWAMLFLSVLKIKKES